MVSSGNSKPGEVFRDRTRGVRGPERGDLPGVIPAFLQRAGWSNPSDPLGAFPLSSCCWRAKQTTRSDLPV